MTPVELTEAISTYVNDDYGEWMSTNVVDILRSQDAIRIADAFTDPAEINLDVLRSCFESRMEGFVFFLDGVPLLRVTSLDDDSWWFYDVQQQADVCPQPKTRGDVAYLLHRLGRTKETR